jgi:hypothetical protein
MPLTIAFFPHNQPHTKYFSLVADLLKKENDIDSLFIKEVGQVEGQVVFQFELELEKIWDDIDISSLAFERLKNEYPDFDFMRALYSEREFNYYPFYFGNKIVSRQFQLKYIAGCFYVFKDWISRENISFIVSELIIGLADGVLREVAEKNGIAYYSIRQSKMTQGMVVCNSYYDEPLRFLSIYNKYLVSGVPCELKEKALSHISDLKNKIKHPSYMELTKKPLRISLFKVVRSLFRGVAEFGKKGNRTPLTIRVNPRFEAYRIIFFRLVNLYYMNRYYNFWFTKTINSTDKYFIYPLHYEPEASTLVRAFHFSDQLALIKLIAKLLPIDSILVVKEHSGNKGYRKTEFYRELFYMPNIVLRPPEYDVSKLINNSMCVITLTGRMGWEAIVNNKPVITLGRSFWSSIDSVYCVQSWKELSSAIMACYNKKEQGATHNKDNLVKFTAAYMACTYKGNFVINSSLFATQENVALFKDMLLDLISSNQ